MRRSRNNFSRTGFTLVESLMSVVIVSGVLVAALGTLGGIGRARQVQVDRAAAAHLGDRIVAEILQCYFQEPGSVSPTLGPEVGESGRAQFDDVDDYENWTMNNSLTLRNGTAMSEYTGWKVLARIDHVLTADPSTTTASVTGLKRIKVTVKTPTGASFDYYALRSRNGAYEQSPATDTTYLTGAGVSAKVGERGKTIYGGAHPLNVTTSQ